jgi:D-3-phosphoglycerate dehydrogenase
MSTQKKRVLLAHILGQAGKEMLADRDDIECVEFHNTITPEALRELCHQFDEVHAVILGVTPFGEAELEAARGLQVVSRIGVGFDAVDIPCMTRAGVPVMVCANANHRAVAEHTLSFMLGLAKRLGELDSMVKSGRWQERYSCLPTELEGSRVLIVGLGRIGSRVARLCLAFGMQVSAYDPYRDAESFPPGVQRVASLDEALPAADYVTLHCPKTPETLGMFGEARLAQMKPGAFLITTARGGIVDEAALYRALQGKRLGGAALDVFMPEAPPTDNPLFGLPNVLCSPHLSGVSQEAVARMGVIAAHNVLEVLAGNGDPDYAVNPVVLQHNIH